jgi:putative ABC transport system permease protein
MGRRGDRGADLVHRGAVWLYRLLMGCYSRAFRDACGPEPAALFGEACREDWSRRGFLAVARRVVAAVLTVPVDGLGERRARHREARARSTADAPHRSGPALAADLRHAFRAVRHRPGLSVAISATLAVGIGINTASFSVIDSTLLRPLPYVNASRVVWLEALAASGQTTDPRPSSARAWVSQAPQIIDRLELRRWRTVVVTGAGAATSELLVEATPGYLSSIGARPVRGRFLSPADAQTGAAPVVVISAALWRSRFGARADIIGARMALDDVVYAIVGVASEMRTDNAGLEFRMVGPLADKSDEPARAVAWLRPGVSLELAQSAIAALAPAATSTDLVRAHVSHPTKLFWGVKEFRTINLAAGAAGWLVLIIAGINVANMLLAAGQTRLSELAVRRALGASPWRIVRLLLFETGIRALPGAALGLALAWVLVPWMRTFNAGPQWQTALERIRLDPIIVAYTLGVALLTAFAAGLVPALRGSLTPASDRLKTTARSVSGMKRGASALLAVETGLAAVLLVAASLVGHAFLSMRFADRGFAADRVLGVRLTLPPQRYPTPASRAVFFDKLIDDVSRLPGVERANIGYGIVPRTGDFIATGQWSVAGSAQAAADLLATRAFVAPGYFALLGIPFLQGEDFRVADATVSPDAPQPTVISRSLAAQLFADGVAIGRHFQIISPTHATRYRVIGVAADVRVWGLLLPNSPNRDAVLYSPMPEKRYFTDLILRVRQNAPLPISELRAAIARLDPDVPSDDELGSAAKGLDEMIGRPRFTAALFSVFAGLAVLLVGVGLSAVVSHAVVQRTREIGIRLALGARPGGVQRLILVQGLKPALVGVAAGIGTAIALTRFIRALLYDLSPTDTLTMIGVPLLVIGIVVVALVTPALRASRVDPIAALRTE